MSRVCPECGREYFGQTVKCIHCSIPLVEKSGSQVAQQTRGRTTQQTRHTEAHINSQRVQNSRAEQESARQQQQLLLLGQEQKKEKKGKQKNSTLGILALVFSILGCTFWIGIVLAIIDLCRKDGRKKILSISSIVICALWIGISVGASQISDSERKNSEPKNLKVESSLLEESDKIYKPKNEEDRVEYKEQETKTNETIEIKEERGSYEPENIDLSKELSTFSSGEYLFITTDDLDKYHSNMGGVKVYVVTDIDDMTPNKIQSTLSGGYMMSNFDVGNQYSKYEAVMKKGDMVAIMGTVTGHDDFGFMGTSVSLNGCRVFAVGDSALSYLKNTSDIGLSQYFFTAEEEEVETETTTYNNNDMSETEYKSLCNSLDYEDIMRNPDSNKDRYCTVSGTVDQIIEGWFESFSIFIVDYSGNKWGCTYSYKDGESRLMEGDSVTVYGKCKGTDTTKTVLGQQVTMPRVEIEYIH